ncbi:MAG TPA: uroporphyrinogen-III C-methyltransferase [Mycobacteriales bacterium]|nr:uroporphyrinogen-III C-methyltransferase [Mycobacteriales bacterium]
MTERRAGRCPLFLDLSGRRVLVVGGGPVAARRVRLLLEAGARVDVVAPQVCEDLAEDRPGLQASLGVSLREYADGDVAGAWLVVAATDDRAVNDRVAGDAERERVWCVRADDAGASAAWTPAVARSGEVAVAVTAGGDPRLAARVRDAIRLLLDTGRLPLRRGRRAGPGHVALVGGGPGDPGLLTVRGRRRLAEADVVVVDRLAPREVLDELDPDVEVVEAGKAPHAHALSQDEINELIVTRARAGQRVVRLKGGDPYLLGRGGEETLACAAAGVEHEVVPGVTSAIAVPAAAGIPVTHRGVATQVTVVSAHCDSGAGAGAGAPNWTVLAHAGGTLVLLMAVARLRAAAEGLVGGGLDPQTPAAIIERGTTPEQQVTTGTVGSIADAAAARGVRSPAVVVVGDVVRVREALLP